MTVMNKTPLGTIQATRWSNGISMGLYNDGNVLSLEYNPEKNKLELIINKDKIKDLNIDVKHVSNKEF